MKTLDYVLGNKEEIEVGKELYFGQLWDGCDGDGEELLESGSVSPDEENVVTFEIVKKADDVLESIVKVTDVALNYEEIVEEMYDYVKDLSFLEGRKFLKEKGFKIVDVEKDTDGDYDGGLVDIYFIKDSDAKNYLEFVAIIEEFVNEGEGSCDIEDEVTYKDDYDVVSLFGDCERLSFKNGYWAALVNNFMLR